MKKSQKKDNQYLVFGVTIGLVLIMTAFCYFSGLSLIIPILVGFVGYQLSLCHRISLRLYLELALLMVIMAFGAHAVHIYTSWSFYAIPVASIAMLIMLLFNSIEITFLMAFATSAVTTLVLGVGFDYFIIYFLGGLTGAYFVRDARTRGKLLVAGFAIGIVQVVAGFFLDPIFEYDKILGYYRWLFLNGFICTLFVAGTLKIFEMLFGELTNFSLLELSDSLNQPLLKRMAVEAPGTYHHSLIVANMAEAAADSIGANALLTRVGAYYHDIGKMVKQEYFTENQMMMDNKHDTLEPSMSKLVILNHVKEGVELAHKHRLNPKIIDFITQHHGTSLMYYFYQKAIEDAEEGEMVDESEYRYPGPKPQSKETAVTLLADSVEGATRALDEHSPKKIDETVRKIINNKFIDGQLDECNLTLKEIEAISMAFTRVLSATYHGRVKYPDQKSNGNQSKKSDKTSAPTSSPEDDRPTHPET